jgi:hypothetical protein
MRGQMSQSGSSSAWILKVPRQALEILRDEGETSKTPMSYSSTHNTVNCHYTVGRLCLIALAQEVS